jgi:MTH538 TIR-like domain (DUF1863)
MAGGKNVFVSHIQEDEERIDGMKSLLRERGFDIKDSSITRATGNDAHDPGYIKSQILAPAIGWSSTVVVLISPDTKNHEWVTWEIEYAQKTGKRIVGVWTHGAAECDVPEALDKYADAVVGWNGERIEGAISGDINDWESSEGSLREPRAITRYSC